MGGMALFGRVVALLAAVGLFAVLVAGVSADDGDEETVAEVALRPTRVIADIPDGYEVLFQLQWGGGSFSQLKGRLAGQGCALNTLWVYGEDRWHGYNRYDLPQEFLLNQQFIERYEQDVPAGTLYATCADQPLAQDLQLTQIVAEVPRDYDTMFESHWGGGSLLHFKGRLATMGCMVNNIQFIDPETNTRYTYNQYNTRSTDPTNRLFLGRYEQFLPAGTLTADCYNVCEFKDRECLSFEEARRQNNNWDISGISDIPCTDDFHPIVQEKVFPILPIRPDTCIIRTQNRFYREGRGVTGFAMRNLTNTSPAIATLDRRGTYRSWTNEHNDILLHLEVHELCHINQNWQRIQQLALNKSDHYFLDELAHYFFNSSYGKEYVKAVGYDIIAPLDSSYRDLYDHRNKKEMSAELCTLYILDKIGAKSRYNYEKWDISTGLFREAPVRDFDTSKYLTPEVVEWLETYMILPDVSE